MSAAPLRRVEALREDHRLDEFGSGVDALDRWVRQSPRTPAAAGAAATYVLRRRDRAVGCYSLAMSSVAHGGPLARLRRGMPDPVPVVLLARLALDRTERGTGLGRSPDRRTSAMRARRVRCSSMRSIRTPPRSATSLTFWSSRGQRLWRRISDIEHALAG